MSSSPVVASVFGVEPLRIGGVETYARELSAQLGEFGWDSLLCFLKPPPPPIRRFLELPNVRIEVFEQATRPSLSAAWQMGRILRKHRPAVLHLHFTDTSAAFLWPARFCGVKKVFFTDHISRPEGWTISRRPLWKRIAIRMLHAPITTVICVSEYNRRCLAGLGGLPQDRLQCIYNGVDLGRIAKGLAHPGEFRRAYSIPQDRVVVMQVCWMIPEKGIADLLQAAKLVLDKSPNVHFIFAGEGRCRQEYEQTAERLGLGPHVTFTGRLQDPMAEGAFAAADIVCQVSRWEEAFGWTIAEAMASGKPLVATRVGGIPEVVADGKSGYLVDRGDVAAMAEKILSLAAAPALCASLGETGRQICETKFDMKKNVAALIRFYRD
jgi:glycosyltransferase involved in cell wall biosynthesis